jgi:mannan endo-1,4-beta-mannosidase
MVAFDAKVQGWADANTTATSPIRVVDQWTNFIADPTAANTDTVDGVHPNTANGCPKIAKNWYAAVAPML